MMHNRVMFLIVWCFAQLYWMITTQESDEFPTSFLKKLTTPKFTVLLLIFSLSCTKSIFFCTVEESTRQSWRKFTSKFRVAIVSIGSRTLAYYELSRWVVVNFPWKCKSVRNWQRIRGICNVVCNVSGLAKWRAHAKVSLRSRSSTWRLTTSVNRCASGGSSPRSCVDSVRWEARGNVRWKFQGHTITKNKIAGEISQNQIPIPLLLLFAFRWWSFSF